MQITNINCPDYASVETTGARYLFSSNSISIISRIDAKKNDYKDRVVARLSFADPVQGYRATIKDKDRVRIRADRACFDIYADGLLTIEATKPLCYIVHNNMGKAPWRSHESPDRYFADERGGWLSGKISGEVINSLGSDTGKIEHYESLAPGAAMGYMAFPPNLFDKDRLLSFKESKPFVKILWAMDRSDEAIKADVEAGFGVYVLWNTHYTGDLRQSPFWRSLGIHYGYQFRDIKATRKLIRQAADQGIKCIGYLNAPGNIPTGAQSVKKTLEVIKALQIEAGFNGWYIDNASVKNGYIEGGFWETYNFVKKLREQIGPDGILFHHNSVDPWGGHSGRRAVMIDAYCDYTMSGETGPLAEIKNVNDPFLQYYCSGYGSSQAYGAWIHPSKVSIKPTTAAVCKKMAQLWGCQRWDMYGFEQGYLPEMEKMSKRRRSRRLRRNQ